jgi:hypothetical protein
MVRSSLIHKEVEGTKVSDNYMNEKEMINNLIDKYTDLQRIKKEETGQNKELEYQLTITKAKLESFGIITQDLEIK